MLFAALSQRPKHSIKADPVTGAKGEQWYQGIGGLAEFF
jgi:hypothetical protein